MKAKIIVMSIMVISLITFTMTKQSDTVVIYSSMEQFRNNDLQDFLQKEFPEVDAKVVYMPTGKAAAKIELEGNQTDANIVLGLEIGYMNKVSSNFENIEGLSNLDYLTEFDPSIYDNKFIVWERFAGAFIINEELLKEKGLPIPYNYEELLNPIYENLIAMPDPKSSGTGYFFVKSLINELGEETAFEYFDDLEKNVKQFTESGSGPIKLLNQGEVAIGLGMTFQAINEINSGREYSVVYPPQGSPYSFTGTGLVNGNKEDSDVMKIFDYIINDFIIYDKENFSPELIYEGQEIIVKNYPKNIKYSNMNGIDSIEDKERILDQWKY